MPFLKSFSFIQKAFTLISFAGILLYGAASLTPYINPQHAWPFTLLALGFPFIFLGYCLLVIASVFIYRKLFIYLFIFLFAGWKNLTVVFAFHPASKFNVATRSNIRLLSWNVNDFVDSRKINDTAGSKPGKMFAFIKEMNADVLCLQDFVNFTGKYYRHNTEYIRDSLGYPFVYFPYNGENLLYDTKEQYGVAIFSRFPIVDSSKMAYCDNESEKFIYADILIKEKIVRFYSAHLKSMGIHTSDKTAEPGEKNFLKSDTALFLHRSNLRTLKYFDKIHVDQAKCIKRSLDTTKGPFVFCADLNSVPSSYTYHTLCKGLNDAFIQNGFGMGKTYDSISPTLRIDVVLFSKHLQAIQHQTPHLHLSDHYPNVTDIAIK
ncbi:MAG: endonuclease/exonuclease/phosphatase family protein [Sphingobacteriia bacterium]|nr:endonuclease/exonuclease/phosphatase family protein [Sphingobacteriia bacterium]